MSKQRNRQRKTKLDAKISELNARLSAARRPTQFPAVIAEDSPLITPECAAALLGVTPNTLGIWRTTRRYPLPFVKVGRLVRYKRADILAFIESRTRSGTGTAA